MEALPGYSDTMVPARERWLETARNLMDDDYQEEWLSFGRRWLVETASLYDVGVANAPLPSAGPPPSASSTASSIPAAQASGTVRAVAPRQVGGRTPAVIAPAKSSGARQVKPAIVKAEKTAPAGDVDMDLTPRPVANRCDKCRASNVDCYAGVKEACQLCRARKCACSLVSKRESDAGDKSEAGDASGGRGVAGTKPRPKPTKRKRVNTDGDASKWPVDRM